MAKLLITLLISLLAIAPFAVADEVERLEFNVLLGDRQVGEHSFEIVHGSDAAVVTSRAQMDVKVLFVNVFKYRHEAKEIWSDSCLLSIESNTLSQGDRYNLTGQGGTQSFTVRAEQNERPLVSEEYDQCLASYAYWDREKLERGMLINSQTGQVSAASLRSKGESGIPGTADAAQNYELTTEEAVIDLWYDTDDVWIALQTETNGRMLTYINKSLSSASALSRIASR